jgi:hypothetical protein
MTEKIDVLPVPCKSCPYRKDVPSGVWAAEEYDKLPNFDGTIIEQAEKGAVGLFLCHQGNDCLCSGWLGCHGPFELLGVRLYANRLTDEALSYKPPANVPLFSSGKEAAEHGKRDIDNKSDKAEAVVQRLLKKQVTRRGYEPDIPMQVYNEPY